MSLDFDLDFVPAPKAPPAAVKAAPAPQPPRERAPNPADLKGLTLSDRQDWYRRIMLRGGTDEDGRALQPVGAQATLTSTYSVHLAVESARTLDDGNGTVVIQPPSGIYQVLRRLEGLNLVKTGGYTLYWDSRYPDLRTS